MIGGSPARTWDDERLVAARLSGNQQAWSALIDKFGIKPQ